MFLKQSEPGISIHLQLVYNIFCQDFLFQGSKFAEIFLKNITMRDFNNTTSPADWADEMNSCAKTNQQLSK